MKIMTFKFHCPHCEQRISSDIDDAGELANRPACGGVIIIP